MYKLNIIYFNLLIYNLYFNNFLIIIFFYRIKKVKTRILLSLKY